MNLINLAEKFELLGKLIKNIEFKDVRLSDAFTSKYRNYIQTQRPNGYIDIEWADFSAKIITSSGKLIFATNFWFYIAKELSDYLSGLEKHGEVFKLIYANGNTNELREAAGRLRNNGDMLESSDRKKIEDYFQQNGLNDEQLKNFIAFVSDYDSWGGGKTIDRNDFYVSALLKAGNLLAETQSAIAEIARQFSSNPELVSSFQYDFVGKNQGSVPVAFEKSINPNVDDYVTLPKPFLLLAGISGTGKSRFVCEQAKQHNQEMANFSLVAVRPDWHEPSDLLGYVSRLSGTASYVATDVLRFMVTAWKSLHTKGLQFSGSQNQTVLTATCEQLDEAVPYWLCLDEMNLAPVEQYFADYLIMIETRNWEQNDHTHDYSCDALLKASVLKELNQEEQKKLASNLGLDNIGEGESDHGLWKHFLDYGIAIPPNLIVAGTVNMDETTHGFSRKVIDRAMSFDFGEFFPNKFDDFYTEEISHASLTFPRHSSGKLAVPQEQAQPSIDFLQSVNSVLKGSPFELAFRALNELLLSVYCHGTPIQGVKLQAVWDDFLMQKVLPRIEGDVDKLQGTSGDSNLLTRLRDLLEKQLGDIWAEANKRPDFYRLKDGQFAETECRSKHKLNWMLDRLNSSGFTSFWP